jgi:O-antigen ligase
MAAGFIDTPLRRAGAFLMVVFVFFAYGRVLDLYLPGLHIPYTLSLMALVCAALSGGLPTALLSRIGVLLSVLTGWMVLCVPFSYWKSNSIDTINDHWLKSYMLAILLMALVATVNECRRITGALAFGVVVVSALALHANHLIRGRLMLAHSALNNPNDLAQVLLMGLPFLVVMGFPGSGFLRRTAGLLSVPLVLYVILKTASRGALLAIVVAGVFMFYKAPMVTKIKLAVLGLVGSMVFVAALPKDVRSRYMTLFAMSRPSAAETADDLAAIESAAQRKAILKQAIRISIYKPLFGAGPGNFQAYAAVDSHETGRRANWLVTHNTYLQWSSECGFPAAILFIASLVFCFRRLSAVIRKCNGRPAAREISRIAIAMQFSFLTYVITAFFSSTAYEILYPTLAGICMAFLAAADRELKTIS